MEVVISGHGLHASRRDSTRSYQRLLLQQRISEVEAIQAQEQSGQHLRLPLLRNHIRCRRLYIQHILRQISSVRLTIGTVRIARSGD